jgi:hypothetical protein
VTTFSEGGDGVASGGWGRSIGRFSGRGKTRHDNVAVEGAWR